MREHEKSLTPFLLADWVDEKLAILIITLAGYHVVVGATELGC